MPRIKRILDCTHISFHHAPFWITVMPMEIYPRYFSIEKDGGNVELIRMLTHTGTHIDVPFHMIEKAKRITDMPLDAFIGEAIVLDASDRRNGLHIALEELKPRYDQDIRRGDIILLYTGWGEKRAFTSEWLKDFPTLTPEASEWLAHKEVKGVCVDTIGVEAYPQPPTHPVHMPLLSAGIWIGEEVYFPKEILERKRWWFEMLPWKIDGGGSPSRAVAIEWEE